MTSLLKWLSLASLLSVLCAAQPPLPTDELQPSIALALSSPLMTVGPPWSKEVCSARKVVLEEIAKVLARHRSNLAWTSHPSLKHSYGRLLAIDTEATREYLESMIVALSDTAQAMGMLESAFERVYFDSNSVLRIKDRAVVTKYNLTRVRVIRALGKNAVARDTHQVVRREMENIDVEKRNILFDRSYAKIDSEREFDAELKLAALWKDLTECDKLSGTFQLPEARLGP